MIIRYFVGVALALFFVVAPQVAEARWLRAESERFIVYSDGDERVLRAYVTKLEAYDRLLRHQNNLRVDDIPPRKLPIYLVGSRSQLGVVRPGINETIAGFYAARESDIFAIGIRTRGEDYVLLHEYAHHFMLQNFAYGYPSWYVEGFAEYFMTAEIEPSRTFLGKFSEARVSWLQGSPWLPLEDLLTKRPFEVTSRSETYYPLSWLLTHWFMSDPARKRQLMTYTLDVGRGTPSVKAMENATGMSLPQLERTLRSYLNGRLQYQGFNIRFPQPTVTVTVLSPAADDLLLVSLRLKLGAETDEALLEQVRGAAARHGDDVLARLTLARAELAAGSRSTAQTVLDSVLEHEADNIEALQLSALAQFAAMEDDDADSLALAQRATTYLARAYAAAPNEYLTLMLLGRARQYSPGYPSENDLLTWDEALYLAPQLDVIRVNAAQALIIADRQSEAIEILQPVANAPHGGSAAGYARSMIARASGETESPALPEDEAPEEEEGV